MTVKYEVQGDVQGLRVLVTGATGKLGQLLVPRLLAQRVQVRALSRQPERAAALWGPAVQVAQGDLNDATTLDAALQGVTHLFLLSPIDPQLAQQQINAIDAAERAGVQRIVKLSGSQWTLQPPGRSLSGDLHQQVEQRLAQSSIGHAVLQPNAWAQVALGRLAAQLQQEGAWTDPFDGAAVAYIDAEDIADVAVAALLELAQAAPGDGEPWVLTGPQALTLDAIAAQASALLGRPVPVHRGAPVAPATPVPATAAPTFVAQVHAQFRQLIRSGEAATVTDTVAAVLGRPARTLDDFLRAQLHS